MIALYPYDVFIFSDGKPFNKGEETFRESKFFINPIPLLSFANKVSSEKLNVEFISLIENGKLYFKVPIDIKRFKYEKEKIILPILKKISEPVITNEKIEYILEYPTEKKIEDINGYLNIQTFVKYLNGELEYIKEDDILKIYSEIRTGIEIDRNTRTTVEGMLYSQNFTRFSENTGFLVKFNKGLNSKFFTIGGEGKVFKADNPKEYIKDLNNVKEKIKEKIEKTKLFKIILLTSTNSIPKIEGANLIAKVIGKPITYSGWLSYYRGKINTNVLPTRIFRLIPEGSVFYYKLEDSSKLNEIFENYWLKPSFLTKEYPYFDINNPTGFGITIIGTI